MPGILNLIRLARPYNALLPALAAVGGYAAAGGTDVRQLAAAVGALVFVHSAVTIWNDVEDETVDELNGFHRLRHLRQAGYYDYVMPTVVLLLAIAAGLCAVLPPTTSVILAGLVLLGWAYNARPIRASMRPVASMLVLALSYGLAPFAIGASLGTTPLAPTVLLLAAGWTAGRGSISLMKDYKDAPGDAKAGKKTFLLVYGARRVAILSVGLGALGYLGVIAGCAWSAPGRLLVVLASAAGWLLYERSRLLTANSYRALDAVFRQCLRYQLVFDGLAVLWLITS